MLVPVLPSSPHRESKCQEGRGKGILKKKGKTEKQRTSRQNNCLGEKGRETGANAALGVEGKEMGGGKGRKPLI